MKKSSTAKPKGLIDNNILIYAHDAKSRFHLKAKTWLETSSVQGDLFISWQNLLEFYSIITSPKRTAKPIKPNQATLIVNSYLQSFEILYPNNNSEKIFMKLIKKTKISGPEIYDLYLTSTALGNGVKTIFTTNTKDFSKIPGFKAVNPLK